MGFWLPSPTRSPSHQVWLKLALHSLVVLFRKTWIELLVSFRSSPPCFSQLLLAWDQVFNSSTNSKHRFPKTNLQLLFLRQASDLPGTKRNPTEMHKKIKIRSNISIVITLCSAWALCAARAVAGAQTEQGHFNPSHENQRGFSKETLHMFLIH